MGKSTERKSGVTGSFVAGCSTGAGGAAAKDYEDADSTGITSCPYHLVLDEMNLARVERDPAVRGGHDQPPFLIDSRRLARAAGWPRRAKSADLLANRLAPARRMRHLDAGVPNP